MTTSDGDISVDLTSRPPRRRLSTERRKDEILAASLRLLAERPPDAFSIEDVAAEAGASRALVYHYFGNKEALLTAAVRAAVDQFYALVTPPHGVDPRTQLSFVLDRFLTFAEQHAASFAALLGPQAGAHASGEIGLILRQVRQTLLDRLCAGLGLTEPPPEIRMTLKGWLAAGESMTLDWLQHRDVPREQLLALLGDQLVVMLSRAARLSSGKRCVLPYQ